MARDYIPGGGPMGVKEAKPGQSPDAATGRAPSAPAAGGVNQSADKLQSSLNIMESRAGAGKQHSRKGDGCV